MSVPTGMLDRHFDFRLGRRSSESGRVGVVLRNRYPTGELTLKSIDDQIAELVARREIVGFEPEVDIDVDCCRRMWMHKEVYEWHHPSKPPRQIRAHRANARAMMRAFVAGADFDDDDLLKPLGEPHDCVFEIRIVHQPQTRVFGTFLRPGEFLATFVKPRSVFDIESWEKWIEKSKFRASGLFPNHVPLVGIRRSDLLRRFQNA